MKNKIFYIILCVIIIIILIFVSFKIESIKANIYADVICNELNKE